MFRAGWAELCIWPEVQRLGRMDAADGEQRAVVPQVTDQIADQITGTCASPLPRMGPVGNWLGDPPAGSDVIS